MIKTTVTVNVLGVNFDVDVAITGPTADDWHETSITTDEDLTDLLQLWKTNTTSWNHYAELMTKVGQLLIEKGDIE